MAAKKPADRKPKVDAPFTVDVAGVQFVIDRDVMDDFELLEELADLDSGKAHVLPRLLKRLLGADGYERAKDAIRGEDGRVSMDAGRTLLTDVFKQLDPNS